MLTVLFTFFSCGSIKSSWNISVVKFLLEKLKQELVTSPHNYTDKELKGEKDWVNLHPSLSSSPVPDQRREAYGHDLGGFENSGLKKLVLAIFSPRIVCLFPFSVWNENGRRKGLEHHHAWCLYRARVSGIMKRRLESRPPLLSYISSPGFPTSRALLLFVCSIKKASAEKVLGICCQPSRMG